MARLICLILGHEDIYLTAGSSLRVRCIRCLRLSSGIDITPRVNTQPRLGRLFT